MIDIFNNFFVDFFRGLFSLDIMVYPFGALTFAALVSVVYNMMKGKRII